LKVQVHLYGTLRRFSDPDTPGIWSGELPSHATIRDLLKAIGTSDQEVSAAAINGKTCPFETRIPEGQKIVLVTPIGAG
jgi:sulfur carrier protein ThiS